MSLATTPRVPVSEDHLNGTFFQINGQTIHAELDSGWEDDINIPPEMAQSLGLVMITERFPDGRPKVWHVADTRNFVGTWPPGKRNPVYMPRIWTWFSIPGLPPVRTIASITSHRAYTIVPLTLVTAMGYSVTIRREAILYEPAHEAGIPYNRAWDAFHWNRSPEHRTPPFLTFSIAGIDYPALLDTGAVDIVVEPILAELIGPQPHTIPLELKGLPGHAFPISAIAVSKQYPSGNLVSSELFTANGFDLTFNPNSLQVRLRLV